MKVLQRERAAYRKLDNVRRDHETRLQALRNEQDEDKRKALIIENNLELVSQIKFKSSLYSRYYAEACN